MNIFWSRKLYSLLLGGFLLWGPSLGHAYVLQGSSWGTTALTWSIMPAGTLGFAGDDGGANMVDFEGLAGFTLAQWTAQITAAFNAWSAVSTLTFTQIADNGAASNAAGVDGVNFGHIRVGAHVMDGVNGTLAHGYYPPPNGVSIAGDLHFDSAENWNIGFAGPGVDIFQVAAHEIGHALGLDHTAVANSLMNPFYSEAFSGPQADDIQGIQALYGGGSPSAPLPAPLLFWLAGLLVMGWRLRDRFS